MKTVMIIDRHDGDRKAMETLLASRYEVHGCSTIEEASALAIERKPDAIVLDIESSLVGGQSDPSAAAARIEPGAGVVCAAQATWHGNRPGTCGYLEKPYRAESLLSAVRLAIAESVRETPPVGLPSGRRLVGECPALKNVAQRISLYATDDAPVLILGESGTGKELAAAAIHRASRRGRGKFLPVDCAAITESLIESTLFGTVKGAFTDAVEKRGAFESARGGSIFLDEIGELSLSVQAKFLRTLESGSGARVGSVDQIQYDFRILSATNATLFGDRKHFRPELLHRIDTLVLEMPSLRDHKEDIPALVDSFLTEFRSFKHMTGPALEKLRAWDWPGNVRELRNVVRRGTVLSGSRSEMTSADIEIDGVGRIWQASLF